MEISNNHIRFLGNMRLNVWDCGGQIKCVQSLLAVQHGNDVGATSACRYRDSLNARRTSFLHYNSPNVWQDRLVATLVIPWVSTRALKQGDTPF